MDQRGRLGKRGCAVQRSHHEVQNPNTEEIVKAKLHMVADFFKIYFLVCTQMSLHQYSMR